MRTKMMTWGVFGDSISNFGMGAKILNLELYKLILLQNQFQNLELGFTNTPGFQFINCEIR